MEKIIIVKSDGDDNIIEKLFEIREEEIERETPERTAYIKENNLKSITQDSYIQAIKSIDNIGEDIKQNLINELDILIDNLNRIQSFDCKTYYKAGIKDIINVFLNYY